MRRVSYKDRCSSCYPEGKKCAACGDTLVAQEEIEALGHDYTPWTAVEGTDNHKQTCHCGDEQIKAHNWVELDRVNPTQTSGGKVIYICSACSLTKEETLDKISE